LVTAVNRLGLDGQVAAITAGWQEREGEDEELQEHLQRPVVDLELHRRLEDVFAEDPELFRLPRARQDRLRKIQRLYRYRLDFALEPARGLLGRQDGTELLKEDLEAAIAAVRRLDAEHLERIAQVHKEFEEVHSPAERPSMRRHRAEIVNILERSVAVALAGGHVAVLLNRLRLFGMPELLVHRPLFAWSAGAMALSERIVLFHDSPPQGAGNAEVLDAGIGLVRGVVPLPHARKRLHLDDDVRVSLFVRRFAPDLCLPLDPGVTVAWQGEGWVSLAKGRKLKADGGMEELEEVSS
jgi:hypothetical protein